MPRSLSRKGSVLVLVALVLLVLTGIGGLALDLATLYAIWNRQMTLAESGALRAAVEGRADASPGLSVEFAASPKGPWRAQSEVGDRIARVTRTAVVPRFFMRMFSAEAASTVRVTAMAERTPDGPLRARLIR
jgi:hypothetical protein